MSIRGKLFVGVFSVALAGSQIYSMSLKEAVGNLLKSNPKIKEQIYNYNATLKDLDIAKSGWYPKLDYVGNFGYERTKNSSTRYRSKGLDIYENSFILSQNIFNGWSTTNQIDTQKARVLAAIYHMREVVDSEEFNLVRYYIEVLKNRRLLQIADQNVKINEDIKKKIDKLYKAGLTTKSEREKVLASLALARSNYVVQTNQLKNAIYQFKYYYGAEVDANSFEDPEVDFALPVDYEEGRKYTLQNNPSIKVQNYNIDVAKYDAKEKRSLYYPKVNVEVSQSYNHNTGGIEGRDDRFRAVVNVNYNFFNGFADRAKIEQGLEKVNKEIQIKHDMQKQAIETYDLSWAAYTELQKQLKHLKEYKKYAVRTLNLYSKEFDMGRRSLLDLLSAQNDLINSKSQIAKTKYDLMFAKFRILDAEGIMVRTIMNNIKNPYDIKMLLNQKSSNR